jgi:hypothetical protein
MAASVTKRLREQLLLKGWTRFEGERLRRFLGSYVQTCMDQADVDVRHLEFLRWLVLTGRLTS